jgi:flavin-binding protein dodecin
MYEGHAMPDAIYKKIEIVGTSSESFTAAATNAVAKAGETIRDMRWFEVVEQRGRIADDGIVEYQVTVRIGFRVE